jgi:hypothetical protein
MVSQKNLDRGFERQWMATPWLRLTRDNAGKVTDVVSLLPALDDMYWACVSRFRPHCCTRW